jgi:hypothetical protein
MYGWDVLLYTWDRHAQVRVLLLACPFPIDADVEGIVILESYCSTRLYQKELLLSLRVRVRSTVNPL